MSTWNKTSEISPTSIPGNQVDVILWSEGWATWMKGMFTNWPDFPQWSFYNLEEDRYYDSDLIPDYWMLIETP